MKFARPAACILILAGLFASAAQGQTYSRHRWHPSLAKSPLPKAPTPANAQADQIVGSEAPAQDDGADPSMVDGVLVINQVSSPTGPGPRPAAAASKRPATKQAVNAKQAPSKDAKKSTPAKAKRSTKK